MEQRVQNSLRHSLGVLGLALVYMTLSMPSYAGGESSAGGADDFRIVPAFFSSYTKDPADLTPIRTCYEVIKDFGIESQVLGKMIHQAFREWEDYIRVKKLDDIVPNSDKRIRTRVDLQTPCQGNEELRVYFGVVNDEVKRYQAQFNQPFGFTIPAVDYKTSAMIWIAPPRSIKPQWSFPDQDLKIPDWSPKTQEALAGLLLHEVGHVFGNSGHVEGTVMTSQIGRYLENDTNPRRVSSLIHRYSKIDSEIDLVLCMDCDQIYDAAPKFDEIQRADSDWVHTFRLLTHKEPVLPVSIQFEKQTLSDRYRYPGSGYLVLKDAENTYRLEVLVETIGGQREDSTHLFEGLGGRFYSSSAVSNYGRVQTLGRDPEKQGEKWIPVAINYNLDNVKVKIVPLEGTLYPRPLFVSAQ